MGTRRKARELAVQLLYQHDLAKMDPEEAMSLFWEHFPVNLDIREFCGQLLSEASENWALHRMSVVDRNILRLATYELLDRPDIPPSVSLNEAIEIAKKYSTPDAAVFINGVLDRVKRTVYPVGR
jgi:transcription antitermination protein NusB